MATNRYLLQPMATERTTRSSTRSSRLSSAKGGHENTPMEIDTTNDDLTTTPSSVTSTASFVHVEAMMEMKMDETMSAIDTDQEDTNEHAKVNHNRMQISDDEEEEKKTTVASTSPMTPNDVHRTIIYRLDQTTLRSSAQLLIPHEIISFGRTCHTMYAALNHPLTWTNAPTLTVDISRQLLSTSLTPFLQYCPCLWRIQAADVTPSQIVDAVTRLPQRSYRLVGLLIEPSINDAKNEAACELIYVIQFLLLHDVRMTNHLSRIVTSPSDWFAITANVGQYYFMPDALLASIFQLSQPSSIRLQVDESLADPMANRLAQMMSLTSLEIHSAYPSDPSS